MAVGDRTVFSINPSKKAIYLELRDSNKELIMSIIRKQKKSIIVLNDSTDIENFDAFKLELQGAFNVIFPDKSLFEL